MDNCSADEAAVEAHKVRARELFRKFTCKGSTSREQIESHAADGTRHLPARHLLVGGSQLVAFVGCRDDT